jgi:hypothetical protein
LFFNIDIIIGFFSVAIVGHSPSEVLPGQFNGNFTFNEQYNNNSILLNGNILSNNMANCNEQRANSDSQLF